MEYQKKKKKKNLENIPNQPSKFRTKNLGEINDDALGTCNINSQIKFKTTMLKSSQKYVIIVMHIYLLKELYELETLQPQMQLQIIEKKKSNI